MTDPYRAISAAVVEMAIKEAGSEAADAKSLRWKRDAREWLADPKSSFSMWAWFCGLDPEVILEALRRRGVLPDVD